MVTPRKLITGLILLPIVASAQLATLQYRGRATTPVATMDVASASTNIILQWSSAQTPHSYEVWRSQNGGAYSQFATVNGTIITVSDTTGIPATNVWSYKVRGASGVQGEFSNIAAAVRDVFDTGLNVSEPTWILAFGDLGLDDPFNATSVSFPALKRVYGTLFMDGTQALTSMNFDSLQSVGADFTLSITGVSSISLPALTTVGGGIPASISLNLTSFSAPLLASVGGDMEFDSCALITVSLPNLVLLNGKTYAFDNNALGATAEQQILARGVASSVTSATIFLDGGSNAGLTTLSAQGQADYATLFTAGNTLTINP